MIALHFIGRYSHLNSLSSLSLFLQSNEVKSSYHMELEGYKRVHNELTSNGLSISKLVTDRHRQLSKHVRETTPEILHMYDVWHVAKGEDLLAYYLHCLGTTLLAYYSWVVCKEMYNVYVCVCLVHVCSC